MSTDLERPRILTNPERDAPLRDSTCDGEEGGNSHNCVHDYKAAVRAGAGLVGTRSGQAWARGRAERIGKVGGLAERAGKAGEECTEDDARNRHENGVEEDMVRKDIDQGLVLLDGADQAQQAQHGGDGEVEDQGLADSRGQLVVEVNYAEEEGGIVEQHKGAEGQRDLTSS